ncbi:protein kinase [Archangium gephyra]|uniref:protein kinase n=1 Tax=Archangium gephyra TaxID=48 RepID=UPI003B77D1CC
MTRADEAGTVGRYRWVSRLARGGMAEVFLGVLPGPEGFEKPVVIKRLLPELSGQEVYRQMFAQEARLMAAFGHAHVVSVLDFGLEAGTPYLVLEYVEGVDLARALAARGPLAPALVGQPAGPLRGPGAPGGGRRRLWQQPGLPGRLV